MPRPSVKDRRAQLRRERNKEYHLWKASLLRNFVGENGWKALRKDTIVPPGERLYGWVRNRRIDYKKGVIPDWLVRECESIAGWSWDHRRDATRKNIDNLRAFVKAHGWKELSWETEVDGVILAQWIACRRVWYHRDELEDWIIRAFESIPNWSWDPRAQLQEAKLAALKRYVSKHGTADFGMGTIGQGKERIGRWAGHARELYRDGQLPQALVAELENLPDWYWEPRNAKQEQKLALLHEYIEMHGWEELRAVTIYDGAQLGSWAYRRRQEYRADGLKPWLRRGLNKIPGWRKWAKV